MLLPIIRVLATVAVSFAFDASDGAGVIKSDDAGRAEIVEAADVGVGEVDGATRVDLELGQLEVFGHYTFRESGYTFAPGADLKARIATEKGAIRPLLGAYLARSTKFYPVLEAGVTFEETQPSIVSPYIGVMTGLSLERAVQWSSLIGGPALGASVRAHERVGFFLSYTMYLNAGISNQLRFGGQIQL